MKCLLSSNIDFLLKTVITWTLIKFKVMKKLHVLNKFHSFFRYYQNSAKPYFITTPIFYVNGPPHIGHLQSCLFADVIHRTKLLLGQSSILSTGTDEHGLKIQQAAKAVGKNNLEFCTEISNQFEDAFRKADIFYTHFIRTTSEKHKETVQYFWNILQAKDFIYKGMYEGWYNVSDETFVPQSQIKEIHEGSSIRFVCANTGQTLEKMNEENYLFALSKLKSELLYWLSKDVIKPKLFAKVVELYIQENLQDISVSRQRKRLPWGIAVPNDDTQTIYVWLDALVNYLTVSGYSEKNMVWPPDCQVLGKDILKFHSVYWPAFLIAAGLEPPQRLFCHSHWTVNNEKMSKSKGNVVNPITLINQYGCDGFRYFFLRSATPCSDTDYNEDRIFNILNSELADTLGNLLSRTCAPAVNKRQVFPRFSKEAFKYLNSDDVKNLIESTSYLPDLVMKSFEEYDFFHGVDAILECLRKTNAFLQSQKIWELAKDVNSASKLDTILYISLEVLRISGILLQPIIPTMSKDLLDKLGIEDRSWKNLKCFQAIHDTTLSEKSLSEHNCVLFVRRKALRQ